MTTRQNTIIISVIYSIALLGILVGLHGDFERGGQKWRQADWLINNEFTFVRRGFLGSAILHISDYSGLDPVTLVIFFQAVAVVTIFAVILFVLLRYGVSDKMLLLLLSPAFLLFWFNDYRGSMRKELIVYFSFALLLLSAVLSRRDLPLLVASAAIFVMAAFAHEGNALFFPFYALMIYLIYGVNIEDRERWFAQTWIVVLLIVFAFSIAAVFYAVTFSQVEDYSEVCEPLIARGLSKTICEGAIRALKYDLGHSLNRTRNLLLSQYGFMFFITYALILYPFWMMLRQSEKPVLYSLAVIISAFVFLPLYASGVDWGRWMTHHIFSVLFVFLVYYILRKPDWVWSHVSRWEFCLVFALSLSLGIAHKPTALDPGFIPTLFKAD